jgi:hypothetical protein
VGSRPVCLTHLVGEKPLEEKVNDHVVEESACLQAAVVFGVDGDGVVAGRGILAVLGVDLNNEKKF